jgi:helicase SWR1
MLKKANQKRRLDEMVIADGDFTTDYLQKLDWRDYLDEGQLNELGVSAEGVVPGSGKAGGESAAEIRQALAAAEDEEDATAAKAAEGELQLDTAEFSEVQVPLPVVGILGETDSVAPMEGEVEVELDPLAGTIDGYMINFVENYVEQFD